MTDPKDLNPHTGRPIDEAAELLGRREPSPAGPTPGAGVAFDADTRSAPGGPVGAPPGAPAPVAGDPPAATSRETLAPSQQEMAIRSALETVMDPEINLSVIDLGLIREIHLLKDPDRTHIKMMLTTPFCPYAPQLMADVRQATESVVPQPCEVEILPDAWSPELMPDPGLLGWSY